MKHMRRQRARSADESNKNLLTQTKDQKTNEDNWVSNTKYIIFY